MEVVGSWVSLNLVRRASINVYDVRNSSLSREHSPWTVRDGKAMVADIINGSSESLSGGGEGDGLSGTNMLGEDMMD
jgi:hypothetical protein